MRKYELKSEADSIKLAKEIASKIRCGNLLTFTGDPGAGKTFLCRQIIRIFCGSDVIVTSPTFNLLQIYQAPDFEIYHFDLYRLKELNEIHELGIEEALSEHLCLIEWPEIISSILPENTISIKLSIIDENSRLALISNLN